MIDKDKVKKVLVICLSVLGVFLILVLASRTVGPKTPENNSYYQKNPYTGTEDFVDPDQEPELDGPKKVSVRNSDKIYTNASKDFVGDINLIVSDYVAINYPEESVVYVLSASIYSIDNKYMFTVETEKDKKRFDVEAYLTEQDYAVVYINGEGPFDRFSPYFFPEEGEIVEPL